jgi:hypothetical protein
MLVPSLILWASLQAMGPQIGVLVDGRTTSVSGTVPIAGVTVRLVRVDDPTTVFERTSDARGRFVASVPAGRYRVEAERPGFMPLGREVMLSGSVRRLVLDLPVATVATRVDVSATATNAVDEAGASPGLTGAVFDLSPLQGEPIQALLPLLPGVVRTPEGRLSLGGAPSSRAAWQMGAASLIDPVTAEPVLGLPPEAIASLRVRMSPFTTDVGHFSSGLIDIETRRGGNEFRVSVADVIPVPRLRGGGVRGVSSWAPRVAVSGAPVRDRLWLFAGVQFERDKTRVYDLPIAESDITVTRLAAFVRADAILSPRHAATVAITAFPLNVDHQELGPLAGQAVSPRFAQRGGSLAISDTYVLSPRWLLQSDVDLLRQRVRIGDEAGPMTISPAGRSGQYFNVEGRNTHVVHGRETLVRSIGGSVTQHLVSAGVEWRAASFDGTSTSAPVLVRRADGSLARRLEWVASSTQRVRAFDAGLFVQDRWRPSDRLLVEGGLRWDRDGVVEQADWSPRVGVSFSPWIDGRGMVRGGVGRFVAASPLNIAAFTSYEAPTVTDYGADGLTAVAPPVRWSLERERSIDTNHGTMWMAGYDHRWRAGLTSRVAFVQRRGTGEPVIEPVASGVQSRSVGLRLSDRGRSRAWQIEWTTRYSEADDREITASYVRSRTTGDLNVFGEYYGSLRDPIVEPNTSGVSPTDVPHRLVVHGTWRLWRNWRVSPVFEVRTGFPYSSIDETQRFIGARNSQRFPRFVSLDLSLLRRVSLSGRSIWLGMRAQNVLGRFLPRAVQNNLDAADYGQWLNGIPQRFSLTFVISR